MRKHIKIKKSQIIFCLAILLGAFAINKMLPANEAAKQVTKSIHVFFKAPKHEVAHVNAKNPTNIYTLKDNEDKIRELELKIQNSEPICTLYSTEEIMVEIEKVAEELEKNNLDYLAQKK